MAYVIKSQVGAVAEPASLLAKSGDFYRQRDTYILASRFRNKDCIRLWNDFAAEQPAMARLIIKDVQNDRQASAVANEGVDRRLREAEKVVTKARKPKKPKVTKAARSQINKAHQAQLERQWAVADSTMEMFLRSSNPAIFLPAQAALERRG